MREKGRDFADNFIHDGVANCCSYNEFSGLDDIEQSRSNVLKILEVED
jgi:hypothetical protein